MTFIEAIKAMMDGAICWRKSNKRLLFKIDGINNELKVREEGYTIWDTNLYLTGDDFLADDWEKSIFKSFNNLAVGDIVYDEKYDCIMFVVSKTKDTVSFYYQSGICECLNTNDSENRIFRYIDTYPDFEKDVLMKMHQAEQKI